MHAASSAVAHLRHADSKEYVKSLQSVVAPRRQPNIFRALLPIHKALVYSAFPSTFALFHKIS